MFRRSFLIVALTITFACTSTLAQRRSGGVNNAPTGEVRVKVVLENDSPMRNVQLQVQLLNATNAPIADSYTDTEGVVNFPGIPQGAYTLRVSGGELAATVTQRFTMNRSENTHSEYVHVKMKPSAAEGNSASNPMISAQALNVPDKASKEFDKGNEALDSNDLNAAKKHYSKALEIYPQFGAAENNLATVCQRMNDYACAREALDRALQVDPHSSSALLNMGRLKLMERSYAEAESMFGRALAIDPANPEVLILMAKTELLMHKVPEAIQYARKVHEVPHDKFVLAHLIAARGLEFQNRPLEAATEYEWFLREAPQHPEAPRVREALARVSASAKATHSSAVK